MGKTYHKAQTDKWSRVLLQENMSRQESSFCRYWETPSQSTLVHRLVSPLMPSGWSWSICCHQASQISGRSRSRQTRWPTYVVQHGSSNIWIYNTSGRKDCFVRTEVKLTVNLLLEISEELMGHFMKTLILEL